VSACAPSRATFVDGDVRVTSAHLSGFVVNELEFPAGYTMELDPEDGYVGVVLDGACEKTFVHDTRSLAAGSAFTMPAGAFHATAFAQRPTRVLVLHQAEGEAPAVPWSRLLRDFREARGAGPLGAGWRLAGELHAEDDAWALAAEGLCLELISGYIREERSTLRSSRSRPWLEPVRERLHARLAEHVSLGELAASAGVHPVHLSRSFRERYGMSVGEYVRQVRLDWATAQLAATETPLAVLAVEAGFADQSHFTRAFKRHAGLTPARYRRMVRG
jgi:AraC family transcriptional regulator